MYLWGNTLPSCFPVAPVQRLPLGRSIGVARVSMLSMPVCNEHNFRLWFDIDSSELVSHLS